MFVKCTCNNCPTHLEFDSANAGQVINCPSCGMETTLYIPPPAPKVEMPVQHSSVEIITPVDSPSLTRCPSCRSDVSKMADFCPKCGHRFKYAGGVNLKDPVHRIGLGICAIIIISVIYYILSVTSNKPAVDAQNAQQIKDVDDSTRAMRKSMEDLDAAMHPNK